MSKEGIKIIIYQKDDKVKVKFKNKKSKYAPKEVKDLHLVLSSKIRDILRQI